ncbi:hypothetical protein J437_LFUL010413 [Ladona fulva]|uniref:Uncharacterized protein n=1 Tax=Ladona fulva TaxID=123851 RepID=A0A8K0K863_LADFU|nr:hypothetical protein J437_LFUL010413 [Ladona fulva]
MHRLESEEAGSDDQFRRNSSKRTKWKRQTAVGLELLAEAGNYVAFQRMYGTSHPPPPPPPHHHHHPSPPAPGPYGGWPYHAPSSSAASPVDLYYRQVAAVAAVTLQKPLPYRLYPPPPPPPTAAPGGTGGALAASSGLSALAAASSAASSAPLSALSGYYLQHLGRSMPPPPPGAAPGGRESPPSPPPIVDGRRGSESPPPCHRPAAVSPQGPAPGAGGATPGRA